MRVTRIFAASILGLSAITASAAEPAEDATPLDRDSLIELVSDKTHECRKEKDGSLCANFFSEDGVIKRIMYEDKERRDGVWFIDDQERLCILWQGKIKPLCFLVYEQDDGSYNMIKNDKHISTILGSEPGNSKNL
ncbi:MAG: hypothetical protein KDI82_07940 [Gammaproteobacteria bacterium]|nr:hypothetical protein [Gammaproteobacteria bacterium]